MYGVEGGGVLFYKGASGHAYRFSVHPWRAPLQPLAGVYLATVGEMEGGMVAHRILLVGETDDISTAFTRHPKGGCLRRYRGKSKCVCLNNSSAWRPWAVADLVEAHDPPCNRPA